MEDKKNGLELELTPETAEGVYSNLAVISHSSSEFRIILTPEHAKRLLFALQDNMAKYEAQYGKINLAGRQQGGTATPFAN